jgi:predicted metal-binding protein
MNNDAPLRDILAAAVLEAGATHAIRIETTKIVFDPALRQMCAMNSCGRYNTCWTCPPALGPVEEWRDRIRSFDSAILFQTVGSLEDSFDFEGMEKVGADHKTMVHRAIKAIEALRDTQALGAILWLSVGACDICPSCTYPDEPCRFPDQALVSVEACGINVNSTLVAGGLKYNNGPNTVSYVGMLLY